MSETPLRTPIAAGTGTPDRALHEANRHSWNAATVAHNSHKGDQAAFFRGGGCKLHSTERELLGDVRGAAVVHLQCNCGQDSLSIANLGAGHVTGVDISDVAVDFARQLAADAGITNVDYVRADVYDWLDRSARDTADDAAGRQRFDIAFSSYGAICWLSDLAAWARGVAGVLKPGGRIVLVDYHPVASLFDEDLRRIYPYFADGHALTFQGGVGDYVAQTGGPSPYGPLLPGIEDFRNPHPVHEFPWGIGQIVSAVLDAGLELLTLEEFPYANGHAPFKNMRHLGDQRWALPEDAPTLPLMYALSARKPAHRV